MLKRNCACGNFGFALEQLKFCFSTFCNWKYIFIGESMFMSYCFIRSESFKKDLFLSFEPYYTIVILVKVSEGLHERK